MAAFARSMNWVLLALAACFGLGLIAGCENTGKAGAANMPAKIGKETFYLEIATDDAVRQRGLGGRQHIDDDGGMIFAFAQQGVQIQEFVMRDCPIPIDIIYTDGAGRVLTTYAMTPELPRGENEGAAGDLRNKKYEERLKKYSSKFPATFAIELKAGTIARLGVKEGDLLGFDAPGLKKVAR